MKILYGVQGTGNGHTSRSREVIRQLKKHGHEVLTLFSGRRPDKLWDVHDFHPYISAEGFTFSFKRGKIDLISSIKELNISKFIKDVLLLDLSGFDLVVSDFEPVSAWTAKLKHIPSIGIGSQYSFHYGIPKAKAAPIGKLVIQKFAPVEVPLGLHWFHFNAPILPPVLPEFPLQDSDSTANKILVYLPFEDMELIFPMLEQISDYEFFAYTPVKEKVQRKNITVCPYGREEFLYDLSTSEGVICNAGFELPSEALRLGKKILVKPLNRQMEQISNAIALNGLRLGTQVKKITVDAIQNWLELPAGVPVTYPNVAEILAKWITTEDYYNFDNLVMGCWESVSLPTSKYVIDPSKWVRATDARPL